MFAVVLTTGAISVSAGRRSARSAAFLVAHLSVWVWPLRLIALGGGKHLRF
jgi:hypothetical protein